MCKWSDLVIRVEESGWIAHKLVRRIDAGATTEGADLDAIETRLLQFTEVATRLLLGDSVRPPPSAGD